MSLTFPRDLVLEAYLGRWVDITALPEGRSLRQVEPVVVTWGSNSEQPTAPPSTVEAVLNNQGGHWTPDNPMSDYFDALQARNTPTRLSLRVSRDSFGRTLPTSWGTSDTGDTWSTVAINTTFAVGAGVGTMTTSAVSSFGIAYVTDSYGDCQIAVTGSWALNVAGGPVEPLNLVLRYQPSGTYAGEHYMLRVSVSTAEVLTAAIWHSSLGQISSSNVTIANLVAGAATSWRAKFQAEGQTLRAKVYPAGAVGDPDQFEPLGWHVSAHHERLTGGCPGVRTGVGAGNTNIPVTVSYDHWDVRVVRHTGELTKLEPLIHDAGHRIKTAKIRLAGITQRLGRPQRPAFSSAVRRYVMANTDFTPTDFWPLDELPTAAQPGQNVVPNAGDRGVILDLNTAVVPPSGAVKWGVTDKVLTSVPGFAEYQEFGSLRCTPDGSKLSTSFSAMFAIRYGTGDGSGASIAIRSAVTIFPLYSLRLFTGGGYELYIDPTSGSGSFLMTSGTVPLGAGTYWATFGVSLWNNGGNNIGFHVNVDGDTRGAGNYLSTVPFKAIDDLSFMSDDPAGAVSSVVVTTTRWDTAAAGFTSLGHKLSSAIKGWVGERATARAARLSTEEGYEFDYWGDPAQSRAMGAQRPIPYLDQIDECATVDGAVRYEPRYTAGVALRSRRSMVGTSPTVILSYSGGQVVPPLAQSADDRPTANLVRAARVNGGQVFVEQTTGPMNTQPPGTVLEAVGRSPADITANCESDAQLADIGGWVRALGTTPEVRVPRITTNLRTDQLVTPGGLAVARNILTVSVGDRVQVTGLTAADIYRDLDQIARGGREVFRSVQEHELVLNTTPYEKYRGATYGGADSRYDGAVSTLAASLAAGVTGVRNISTSSGPLWTTNVASYPLQVLIGGELCTVSGITGGGATQTMTVSVRGQNGASKNHAVGARVTLYQPTYYS